MTPSFGADSDLLSIGMPSTTCLHLSALLEGVKMGAGYGLVPALQAQRLADSGQLVDMVPEHSVRVNLYWHHWELEPPSAQEISQLVVAAARRSLLQSFDATNERHAVAPIHPSASRRRRVREGINATDTAAAADAPMPASKASASTSPPIPPTQLAT